VALSYLVGEYVEQGERLLVQVSVRWDALVALHTAQDL